MTEHIDYFLSMISPWAYLGGRRLTDMARSRGIPVVVKPVSTAKVFPETGGLPLPKRAPARKRYRLVELARWSAWLDVPLNVEPKYFPAADKPAALMVTAADKLGCDALELSNRILKALWVEEQDITDAGTLRALAQDQGAAAAGLDVDALIAEAAKPETERTYEANTAEAIDREAFGSPFYIWRGEPFWGQDRLDMLEAALDRPA